jgi:hypothetical protein
MNEIEGRATRMGWKRRKSGDKFEVVIELSDPPSWPINVVWKCYPIFLRYEDPAQSPADRKTGEA